MAFHLRQISKNNDLYLYIYETFRSGENKNPQQRHYKTLGYVSKLKEQGYEDPIGFAQAEVDKLNCELNSQREFKKQKRISNEGIMTFGGFVIKQLISKLNYSSQVDAFNFENDIAINPSQLLNDLAIARIISPASKNKTFNEVLSTILFSEYDSNIKNLYQGLSFLGEHYQKIIQVINHCIREKFKRDTTSVFFDGTNFYFAISREDDLRRKGPSKENKKTPLVGMGLMLDNDLIPIGMNVFPGNESEKPQMREVIQSIKKEENIKGKTIVVADKGLNCARNIIESTEKGDGYIFSKSVKQIPKNKMDEILTIMERLRAQNIQSECANIYEEIVESKYSYKDENNKIVCKTIKEKHVYSLFEPFRKKQLNEIENRLQKAINMNYSEFKKDAYFGASTYIKKSTNDKIQFEVDYEKAERDKRLAGLTLIVTSEVSMPSDEVCSKYRHLWRIEESFKILKSELDTRPIFHHKENNIKGHLLVCYTALTLLRLLEFKEFNARFSSSQIIDMIRKLQCLKVGNEYLNLTKKNENLKFLNEFYGTDLELLYIKNKDMKKLFNK